ncbi:MAG: beta-ketoacyl-ACP synthase II [Lachnospiraceae bacterium]|nr:beta-ketoacyl-ACP synthase II [Lachnospiraceae bacterium]
MKKRVVITGLGAVTPIGNSVEEFWASIRAGKTGFGPITYFDTGDYRCKLAAQVKDFDPGQHMDKKAARRMEQFCQFAVAAAGEALKDAKISMEEENPYRVGCCIGSGIGSLQAMEREYDKLISKGPSRISPLMVPLMISNMAAGNVSIAFGLKGKNMDVVTACASGTNSVGEAFRSIQYGDADIMVAGGAESSITPLGVSGFTALTAVSLSQDPEKCSIPFDKDRNGFVMGEGAGILILEELEHAQKRGAYIYAEVVGYGCTSDAYHITSPAEDGEGAAQAMMAAMKDAGVTTEEITYINAHGTSTPYNDLFETRAIKMAFGEQAKKLRINSTKSMIGHLLGAAGAVELVACVKEVEEGFIHQTVGFTEAEEEMDLNYCGESYEEEVPYALSNSLGFGGHNASILIKKF